MGTKTTAGAVGGAGAALMAIVMGVVTPSLQKSEATRYVAYKDIVGVLTVCTGHTGPDVVVGKVYTDAECTRMTQGDAEKATLGVLRYSPQLLYHPIVLASAVSFSYNVGVGTYAQSSVNRDFNAGNLVAGCNDLLKYTMAGGQYSKGLANRRAEEHKLCMSTLTPQGIKDVPTSVTD